MRGYAWLAAITLALAGQAEASPLQDERIEGVRAAQVFVPAAGGIRLEASVTRPVEARGRLPAILFVQWLSCDTVAVPSRDADGWAQMLAALARQSGAMLWRTERRGVGASGGRCEGVDYETDIDDQRRALAALRARPEVDARRIVILGGSMGATIAPLLAAEASPGQRPAGVLVWGGGARSWAERTLDLERTRIEQLGVPPDARAAEMAARLRAVTGVLVEGRDPLPGTPLGADWSRLFGAQPDGTLYGRPLAFHRQAQARNWAAAWATLRMPVLAMAGENDWLEQPDSVRLIAALADPERSGRARAEIVPGLSHGLSRCPDKRAALRGQGCRPDAAPALAVMLPWLRNVLASQ